MADITPVKTEIPASVAKDETVKPVPDAFQLTCWVWMAYKLNMITRVQVRDFLDIIRKGDWPEDIVKYLTDDLQKL